MNGKINLKVFSDAGKRGHKILKSKDPKAYSESQQAKAIKGAKNRKRIQGRFA